MPPTQKLLVAEHMQVKVGQHFSTLTDVILLMRVRLIQCIAEQLLDLEAYQCTVVRECMYIHVRELADVHACCATGPQAPQSQRQLARSASGSNGG